MSKGQQAMVVAMMYPEPSKTKRKGSGSLEPKELGISAGRLSQARTVLVHSTDLARAVLAGSRALDAAYFAEFDGARSQTQPFFRFRFEVARPALSDKLRAPIGGQRHCDGIGRIDSERLFETAQCGGQTFPGEFVRKLLRTQKQFIRIEICRRLVLQPLDFGDLHLGSDGGDHACGKQVQKFEYVARRAFEAIGPDMRTGRTVNELAGEAEATAGAPARRMLPSST
jgi:hypothetical protein